MTDEPEARHAETARRFQQVITSVAEQSQGRGIEETTDLLRVALTMNGLRAPTSTWLEAVAREAVIGRSYVVSTDAEMLGLDTGPERDALTEAPAKLPVAVTRPAGHRRDGEPPPSPAGRRAVPHDATRTETDPSGDQWQQFTTLLRNQRVTLLVCLGVIALLLLRRRRARARLHTPVEPA